MADRDGPYWTYILQNLEGRFYVGSTSDLAQRVADHNDPTRERNKYTAKHGPWELVWSEGHPSRSAAMMRETQIKSMKSADWIRAELLGEQSESR